MFSRGVCLISSFLLVSAQYRNTLDYLSEMNITGEEHTVITEDGYILSMYRIPRPGATPVIAMHGLLATSDMWLLMGRQYNLATILADNNYDVWLPNQRGNAYSRSHTHLPSGQGDFPYWDFSCEEIGLRDLPALMDYVLSATNREKLLYVGHSMGSSVFLILCARLPAYCSKFDAAVFLAPIVYPPQQIRLPSINFLVQWSQNIADSLRKAHIYEFLGRDQLLVDFTHSSCMFEGIFCNLILQALAFDRNNKTLAHPIADYFAATVGGTSVKVYEHLSYIISKSGHFGPLKPRSFGLSNALAPPAVVEYDVDIKLPVGIIWGEDDIFIDDTAINSLTPKLKKLVLNQRVPAPFKHNGYFYDLKKNYGVVTNVLNLFKKYDTSRKKFPWSHG